MQRCIVRLGLLALAAAMIPACGGSSESGTSNVAGVVTGGGSGSSTGVAVIALTSSHQGGTGTIAGFAGALAIDSVAAAGVYTLEAAAPAWVTVGMQVNVMGCANLANNGTYFVTAVTGTSLTLSNGGSAVEVSNSAGVVAPQSTGSGGSGGSYDVYAATGSDIRILPAGSVNSVVNAPVVAPYLGVNPRTVSTNQTWTCTTSTTVGQLTQFSDVVRGDNPSMNATGLWISAGVTLTIHPNFGGGFDGPKNLLQLLFENGVYVEGTLRVGFIDVATIGDQAADSAASFNLTSTENIVVASTGVINLSGRDDSAGTDADRRGGNGGIFNPTANGTLILRGLVDATGGDGDAGGTGGSLNIVSNNFGIYNAGTLDSSGGVGTIAGYAPVGIDSAAAPAAGNTVYTLDAPAPTWLVAGVTVNVSGCATAAKNGNYTVIAVSGTTLTLNNPGAGTEAAASSGVVNLQGLTGSGGNAGSINLATNDSGGVYNTGTLRARGGNGTGNGGGGSSIDFSSNNSGAVTSSGTLETTGGNAVTAIANGSGGAAGSIDFYTNGGTLRISGTVTARGGDGVGASGGGDGNDVSFTIDTGASIQNSNVSGGMALGATIITDGGAGANGGNAGSLTIDVFESNGFTPGQDTVWIVGYSSINLSGATGASNGGAAGNFDIFNDYATNNSLQVLGSIRSEVALIANGGSGTGGAGGNGGQLDIDTDLSTNGTHSVLHTAAINLNGGNGGSTGGSGGAAVLADKFRSENTGVFNANGGTGNFGDAGDAGDFQLASGSVVVNSGAITVNGGVSTGGIGGDGGEITFFGAATTSAGTLTASGANGNASLQGGFGGLIDIRSSERPSVVSGTLSVVKGLPVGPPPVTDGQVRIDGVTQPLTAGVIVIP